MEFKEQLMEDMGVFFNLEEFAECHMINGNETLVIMDNKTLADLYIHKGTEATSLFTDFILIFVQESKLDFEPVPGQYMDFDGGMYIISDVKLDGGVYAIILGVNGH